MVTFKSFSGQTAILIHEIGIKFDNTAGRLTSYLRLQGRSNCPYERAGMETLIAEERENLKVLKLQLDELTKSK